MKRLFTLACVLLVFFNPSYSYEVGDTIDEDLPFARDELLQGQDYIATSDANYAEQVLQISDSLRAAQSLGVRKQCRTVAEVVDAMYQNSSYDVSVDLAAISAQEPIGDLISSSLSASAITWKIDHEDEASVDIETAQNVAVVASQYHNRLIVFNLDAETPERLSKKFVRLFRRRA